MATSGSVNFSLTRNQIIQRAMQMLEIYGADEALTASDLALGADILNTMIKAWEVEYHIWTSQEAVIFLQPGQPSYDLHADSADHAALLDDVIETSTNANLAVNATSVTVLSTEGMIAADIIGIVLDDLTVHWTTIATVNSSTVLTLTTGVTDTVTGAHNVYTYTTDLNRPLKIRAARLHDENGFDFPLFPLTRAKYFDLTNKTLTGRPVNFFYDPSLTSGRIYLYLAPDSGAKYIRATVDRSIEDFDAAGDTPDFPQEWLDCIIHNLAYRLAPFFDKSAKGNIDIAPKASQLLSNLRNWDQEQEDLSISFFDT